MSGYEPELRLDVEARKAYVSPEMFARIREFVALNTERALANYEALRAEFGNERVDALMVEPHRPVEIIVSRLVRPEMERYPETAQKRSKPT